MSSVLASVAQLYACLTGDQEVASLIIFSMIILSLMLIQERQMSFWQKHVHKYWLTA